MPLMPPLVEMQKPRAIATQEVIPAGPGSTRICPLPGIGAGGLGLLGLVLLKKLPLLERLARQVDRKVERDLGR